MVMWKLKIKLSFKYIILFFFLVPIYSQGIFIDSQNTNIISISSDYSKHVDLNDYDFGFGLGILFDNNVQLDLKYLKINKYLSNIPNNSNWDEDNSLIITKFLKNKKRINYSFSLKMSNSKRSNISSTSFLISLNTFFLGDIGTGMKYYPYIRLEQKFSDDFIDVMSQISNLNNYYDSDYFVSIGCFITFNDYWVKPFYRKNNINNTIYEGIQIGIWDYTK